MTSIDNTTEIFHRLAVSESGFVFDPVSGQSFTVNESGIELLRLFQKSSDKQKVHQELLERYQAKPGVLERDINDFISSVSELMV